MSDHQPPATPPEAEPKPIAAVPPEEISPPAAATVPPPAPPADAPVGTQPFPPKVRTSETVETPARYRIESDTSVPTAPRNGWVWVLILAIVLFAAPFAVRWFLYGSGNTVYTPPASAPLLAMTPEPTATAWAVDTVARPSSENISTRPKGPVVIDYAHFNQIDARGMQPLAAALSRRGLSTRVWLTEVDPFAISAAVGFPDQSDALADQLRDASAIVIISPFFFWTPDEIALLERFVADGGRVLLISDPDIYGDAAVYMNLVAEPFGIVFNDDYLYDTTRNDENFTHFFLGEFRDQAQTLADAEIAFYGGRSISGDVVPQAVSAPTTLSSRRTGVSGFTTVAIGDNRGWESGGRVLALSDFDVLTEPNVVRHDNQQMVEFVAEFLASGERNASIADFPAWLDRDVTLMIGSNDGLDADTLLIGAKLQRRLEETGRRLTLAGAPIARIEASPEPSPETTVTPSSGALPPGVTTPTPSADDERGDIGENDDADATEATENGDTGVTETPGNDDADVTLAHEEGGTIPPLPAETATEATTPPADNDVILLADYEYADENTTILSLVGITLEIEYVSPTPAATGSTATATPTATPAITATRVVTTSEAPSTPLVPPETPEPGATPDSPSNTQEGEREQSPPPAGTPTEAPDGTPTGTPDSDEEPASRPAPGDDETPAAETTTEATPKPGATNTPEATATASPTTTPTPTATPTPIEVLWLVSDDGLRLLADQTVLVIRTTAPIAAPGGGEEPVDGEAAVADDAASNAASNEDSNAVIVLGSRPSAINEGVTRLLENDFSDCITGMEVTYCPVAPATSGTTTRNGGGTTGGTGGTATPGATSAPSGTVTPPATPSPGARRESVLLIDDNTAAAEGETSEADHYLRALTAHGVSPDLWSTDTDGAPSVDDLEEYTWVIWSNSSYAAGEVPIASLDPLFAFINGGGRLTISSLKPFFAMGTEAPSKIVDVAVVDDQVALSKGLYSPVNLVGDTLPVAPLAEPEGEDSFDVTLVRGNASDDPESPAMVSATDEGDAQEMGAKLIVVGMSVAWLPADFANQLIANMADWMLAE